MAGRVGALGCGGPAGQAGVARGLWELAGLGYRADPRAATLLALVVPVEAAGGVLQALGLKALTDAALAGDLRRAALAALLLALVGVAWRVASGAALAARPRLGERAGMVLQRRLGELTAAIPTVEHFERPDYLRRLDQMRQDSGWLADGFGAWCSTPAPWRGWR